MTSNIESVVAAVVQKLREGPVPIMPACLAPEQAAVYLSVPKATLQDWRTDRRKGYGPKFIRKGNTVLYRVADLDAWLKANEEGA